MKAFIFVFVFAATVLLASGKRCSYSLDCGDDSGRSVCWSQRCYKNIPCNKDSDCYFYAGSDVEMGNPHPLCYQDPDSPRKLPKGYGTCMSKEKAKNRYKLLPGGRMLKNMPLAAIVPAAAPDAFSAPTK